MHLARARWRPDLYHLTTYRDYLPTSRIKKVITLHDLIPLEFADTVRVRDSLYPTPARLQAVDGIICVSRYTRDRMYAFWPNIATKTTVIHHGAAPHDTVSPPPFAQRLTDRPFVLFVGARSHYKNFSLLAQALQKLPFRDPAPLLVCVGAALSEAERIAFSAPFPLDQVIAHRATDDELCWLYRRAAALVYPSLAEGFGLPLLEAMAQGCPVLCSNASCLPEVGGDAALYFEPNDPAELASCLQKILDDASLRASLAERGRLRAPEFTWEKTAKATADFYREVLGI